MVYVDFYDDDDYDDNIIIFLKQGNSNKNK